MTRVRRKMRQLGGRVGHFLDSRWGSRLLLAIAIGAFLTLTLTRLTASSIWFDESYSAYLMRYDLPDITHYTAVDVHPPMYYYLLKGWALLFGSTPAALRSFSVVLGVVALILVFVLVRRLFNRRAAGLATLLVAISPMFVRYGIEARMYMLVTVIALLATLVFYQLLHHPGRRWAVLYGLLICLGMWTHYFMAVVWLAHWAYRFVYLRRHGLRGRQLAQAFFDSNWLLAHGLAIVLYLPWLPIAWHQMGGLSGGFWIPPITVSTPGDYLSEFWLYQESSLADGWWAVLIFAVTGLLVYLAVQLTRQLRGRAQDNWLLVLALAIVPPVLLMALSLYPFKSVFVDRYLLAALVFLAVAVALCLTLTHNHGRTVAILAALIVGCFAYGDYNVYRLGNYNRYGGGPDKVTLTGEVVEQAHAADPAAPIVVLSNYGYYEAAAYETPDNPIYFLWHQVKGEGMGSLQMQRDNKLGKGIVDMAKFADDHAAIWLLNNTTDSTVLPVAGLEDWHATETVAATDPISGVQQYKATLYEK